MDNIYFIIKDFNLTNISDIDEESIKASIDSNVYSVLFKIIRNIFICPYCGSDNIKIRSSRIEKIKHVLNNGSPCNVLFNKRIYLCEDCNKMFSEKLDRFSNEHGISFALNFFILESLKSEKMTYLEVSKRFNVSVTTVINVFDESVNIKRHHLPQVLSIDEVYKKGLSRTKYCCILFDPINNIVIDVIDSRRKPDLEDYFRRIKLAERENVKFITIDLYKTYKSIAHSFFKKAKLCADPFHVIENLNRCLDKVRLRVMKEFEKSKDRLGFDYWLMKKYWKFLLADFQKLPEINYHFKKKDCYVSKYYILDKILELSPELKEAYLLKESYIEFNNNATLDNAEELLSELIYNFRNSSIEEMNSFGLLLARWKKEIINSFNVVDGWRVTNANIERKNQDIDLMYLCSHGLTNFKRARNRIMYSLNKNEPIDIIK